MDENFFEPLDGYEPKLDSSYSGCVQIQNTSGMMLHVAEGFYLANYAFALISKKNKNLEKFTAKRKIKIHDFTVAKTAKKKKKPVEPKVETPEIAQSIDIEELSAMFTMDKSKFEVANNDINHDEI